MTPEQRLKDIEVMMKQLEAGYEREKLLMEDLKSRGKEKSATYRQFLGNRLMYTKFLAIYKAYGLRDWAEQ